MFKSNCLINADSVEYPAQRIVAARFKNIKSASIIIRKWGESRYVASVDYDPITYQNKKQGINFDSSGRGIEINFRDKEAISLISSALSAIVEAINFWDNDDQVTESVADIIESLPNLTNNVLHTDGTPRQATRLFDQEGNIITMVPPNNADDRQAHCLRLNNLNAFLNDFNGHSGNKTPFAILAELEAIVQQEGRPDETIAIDYSSDSSVLFDLSASWNDGQISYYEYRYSSTVG